MTKKISLLLIALMLINMLAFMYDDTALAANTESFADYTMADIAYSETLKLFVAVGNKNGAGAAFASSDGETWGRVASFTNAVAYGESDCIVWWESEQVFIIYLTPSSGAQTYVSSDGYNWSLQTIDGINRNGGIIIDEDGYLLHFYREFITVYKDFYDYTTHTYTTYTGANGSQIYSTLAFAGGTGSSKSIFVVASYRGGGTWNGGQTWQNIDAYAGTSTIKDGVYSKAQDCFYMATSSDGTGRMLGKIERTGGRSAVDYPTISGRINAISTANGQLVIGMTTGRFYKTPDVAGTVLGNMVWTEMTTTDSNYVPSLPKRFAYGNNKLVALCNKNSGLANSKGQIVVFDNDMKSFKTVTSYKTTPYLIILEGETRIEVPADSQSVSSVQFFATVTDLAGNSVAEDSIDTMNVGQLPTGIAFYNGAFTMQPGAASGVTTLTVTTMNGLSESFLITFVKEAYVVIGGTLDIAIPAYGAPPEDWLFTAIVYGDDEKPMNRTATISVVTELPNGVEFISSQNAIRISYDAQTGGYTIKAASDTVPTVFTERNGTINPRTPKAVQIISAADIISIPNNDSFTTTFVAVVKDQTDAEMPLEKISWSVKDAQTGNNFAGVTINNKGVLTVGSTAYKGSIEITAALISDTYNLFDKAIAALTYTDLRCVTEDTAALNIETDLSKVTENLTLSNKGENDSVITWVSSNNSLVSINPLGRVTRPSSKNESVTLTATVKKNASSLTKTFSITVLKNDNLLTNGNFENGSYDPWEAVGNVQLAVDGSAFNSGTKSLSIANRTNASDGVSQSLTLSNNSTYYIVGYVKGSVPNQVINITSGKASNIKTVSKTVQNDGFTKITCLFIYTKQNNTFTEEFQIYSEGTDGFNIDDFRAEEVTLEYDLLMSAIAKAEYSKLKEDIDSAKTLLESFYDIPEKDSLDNRVNSIIPKTISPNGSGGGGSKGNSGGGYISVPVVSSETPDNTEKVSDHLLIFKDLKSHWAKDDVEYMAKNGYVQGKEDGVFEPDTNITRAEFAALIVRVMGISEVSYQNSFYDVVSEDWFSGIVQSAKNSGLINGSDGLFKPNNPITREEMTKIVVLAYNTNKNISMSTGGALYYSDYYKVSSWAYDYVVTAVNLGFVQGTSDSVFSPEAQATRAQAVIILKRLYDKMTEGKEDTQ